MPLLLILAPSCPCVLGVAIHEDKQVIPGLPWPWQGLVSCVLHSPR